MALALDCADERGEPCFDLVVPEAADQRHPPGFAAGVERIEHLEQRVGRQRWAALHADGVADAAQEFDVGRSFEARAITDPQHVRAGIVPIAGQRILPRHRLFVLQ